MKTVAIGFPLYIDLDGNNCVVFGGGDYATACVKTLLHFGARITVIAPVICEELRLLDEKTEAIRYIPRRYYRGDCTNASLCVAATSEEPVNIAISDECKAKKIPVNLSKPSAFGNFDFPTVILQDGLAISLAGHRSPKELEPLRQLLEETLPSLLEEAEWSVDL